MPPNMQIPISKTHYPVLLVTIYNATVKIIHHWQKPKEYCHTENYPQLQATRANSNLFVKYDPIPDLCRVNTCHHKQYHHRNM